MRFIAIAVLLAALAATQPVRAGEPGAPAVAVARELTLAAHEAISAGRTNGALTNAIADAFAFDLWESFLLEGHRGEFEPAQVERFRALLPTYMARLYVRQFAAGMSVPPEIGTARTVRGDWLVPTTFPRKGRPGVDVTWRLRDVPNQGPKVIDVMVGGTSFLILTREEFGAILSRKGPEALIAYMEKGAS